MRILHTADWHIGRFLNKYSLIEDQAHFLNWLISVIKSEKIDVLIVAGDIYNSAVPSAAAVELLDEFLTKVIMELQISVLIISGNHDSPQKLSFSSKILERSGLTICGGISGIKHVKFDDVFGTVGFTLLPYVDPAMVKEYFDVDKVSSFDSAIEVVVKNKIYNNIYCDVNILCTHGTYMDFGFNNLEYCDSEISIGGSDIVNLDKFKNFDYIALGHLHGPQKAGEKGRYSGSPLKYSVSEANHKKQVVVVDIDRSKNINIEKILVEPLRDLRILRGNFEDIMKIKTNDYVSVQLTDENFIIDPHGRIRTVCPNILDLSYVNIKLDNSRTAQNIIQKCPQELFVDFYKDIVGKDMNELEKQLLERVMEELKNETN